MLKPEEFDAIPAGQRHAEFAWLVAKALLALHGKGIGSKTRLRDRTGLPPEPKRSCEPVDTKEENPWKV